MYTEPEDHSHVLMDEGGFTIDERIFTDISADRLSKNSKERGIKSARGFYQTNDSSKQLYNMDGKGKMKASFQK